MSGSQLCGLSRRMEWVGQQQKTIDKLGARCGQQARLATPVGATPEKRPPGKPMFHYHYGAGQPSLVLLRSRGRWRTMWTPLPVGEITAQNADPGGCEFTGQRDQQRRVRVPTRTVSQHKKVTGGVGGAVQNPADCNLPRRFVRDRADR